jgi:TRAP-type C4-dicarboxylate transport system substrate-binding protein
MHLVTGMLIAAAMVGISHKLARAEKWDMPMAYSVANYHSENAVQFGKCVAEKSGNALEIVTRPDGLMFAGRNIKRAVQNGQANIGERLISAHLDESPIYGIDSVPFLATSFEASEKLWKAAGDIIQATLANDNLVYIYSVPWPPQGIYTKKEITAVTELKGIRFRAYNPATARIAELAEMVPVQVETAQLSQAISRGEAEAFISSGSTGYDRKIWRQLKNFNDVQAWFPRNVVFANKDAWNALDVRKQGALLDCGAKAAADGLVRARELTDFYLRGLEDNGMRVRAPSEELKSGLKAMGDRMTAEWLLKAGTAGKAIIEAYQKM